MSNQPKYYPPPEWVMRYLRWYCDPSFLEEVEGDLFELFQEEVEEHGLPKAKRRFLWIALRYLHPYFFGKKDFSFNLQHHLTMFQHYLKVGFRHLWKQRLYSIINILGLSIGMACCLTLLFYVNEELSYDNYHEKGKDIYRLSNERVNLSGGENALVALAPILWGPALKNDYPEIEKFSRFISEVSPENPWLLTVEEKTFAESRVLFADPSALDMFSWPLLNGDPQTALSEPGTIVITQEMASKYFNEENPIGKTIQLDPKLRDNQGQLTGVTYDMRVTGILKDIPRNSHFVFDFLIPSSQLSLVYGFDINGNGENARWFWRGLISHTYLQLKPGTNPLDLEGKFENFQNRYIGEDTRSRGYYYRPFLQNIEDIYLEGQMLGQLQPTGDKRYLLLFSAVAFFVLLIACINFMNLSTARATTRAREVGLRKVVGAKYKQLVSQFLGESLIITFLGLILAVGLSSFMLPLFYNYLGKAFYFNPTQWIPYLAGILSLGLIVGIFAGGYPAFFLSRFKPIQILQGSFIKTNKGSLIRKGLIVFQFLLSAILIITTLTLFKQVKFMKSADLGFEKDHILVIQPNTARGLVNQYDAIRTELKENANIVDVTMASGLPGFNFGGDTYAEKGQPVESSFTLYEFMVDYNFIEFFDLQLIAGRDFSRELATDAGIPRQENQSGQVAAILNRAAIEQFGWNSSEDALGKQIIRDPKAGDWIANVIGVVEDFHMESLGLAITPTALILRPQYNYMAVKLKSNDIASGIDHIKSKVKTFSPDSDFEYAFLDESFNSQYQVEQQLSKTFSNISLLAIFIACMGLFGLAAFATTQRVKEIGVRKTLGASVTDIVILLSKDFIKLVLIAVGLALPISYFITELGLENFAYRISNRWDVFLLTIFIALLVALLTVSYHTIQAARANPVRSLRVE